jgi:hypothetical protein
MTGNRGVQRHCTKYERIAPNMKGLPRQWHAMKRQRKYRNILQAHRLVPSTPELCEAHSFSSVQRYISRVHYFTISTKNVIGSRKNTHVVKFNCILELVCRLSFRSTASLYVRVYSKFREKPSLLLLSQQSKQQWSCLHTAKSETAL